MRQKYVMVAVAGLAATALTVAVAQPAGGNHGGQGGPPPCADPMPADLQARLLNDFGDKGIDANGDGTLTCVEVKAFFQANPSLRPPRPGGPPRCADPMPADLQAKLLNDFGDKGIDANGDGTLTCAEVKAFFDANPSLRPPRPGGPPPCRDPMPADLQAKLLNDFGDKGIDANGDGTLTCAEVKAFFDANPSLRPPRPGGPPPCTDPMPADLQAKLLNDFGDKGIDANGDGTLTCDEVKAFFQANPQLRPRHGGPGQCTDPIPAQRQAKLLNDFGDKGIDANGDGALTCDEVKAFFQANPQLRPRHGGPANNGKGPARRRIER